MFGFSRNRLLLGCSALLFTHLALGAFPSLPGEDPWLNRPNDPGYGGSWNLFSHIPVNQKGIVSFFERSIGSGVHADKAWQWHTGTPSTVVAVLDCGIRWHHTDLIDRFYLNPQELPLPLGSLVHDANKDGRFSVKDYQKDTRVFDSNKNGIIEPGDLIAIFSNGIDEDGNGYVDDIAGWDFHEMDNDPWDRTDFGHGTGEALDSTAALDNGIGFSGICGNCSVMPVRLNDSFIVDANAFAQGVIYATDQKVALIQQALGSVNHSPLTHTAIEYAYSNHVPIIGSAADENSYHHNYPSTIDPVVYPNAIRYDAATPEESTTFLNFNNCSNYGSRIDVTVPGRSCSSEATGILSGVSSLVLSYAKSVSKALQPLELNALIKSTATDINLGPNTNDPFRHSTYEGWDTITGYGRANAHNMIQAVHEDRIPPIARIISPRWFDLFQPSRSREFAVAVDADAPRSASYSVTLEVLKGVETSQTKATVLKAVTNVTGRLRGEFARVNIAQLGTLETGGLDAKRDENSYTLRLVVRDAQGLVSEARRTIFVFDDPGLQTGFPQPLKGSGESTVMFLDLDGNGSEELVAADGAGYVHAYRGNGKEMPGFPVATAKSRYQGRGTETSYASVVAAVAGGDLDKDGKPEIVVASLEGHVTVIEADGSIRTGFPITLPRLDKTKSTPEQPLADGILASPVLVDLNQDSKLEIVIASLDGRLHVYQADGSGQKGFPLEVKRGHQLAKLVSSPAVYDLNEDGIKDFIMGSNHTGDNAGFLFALDGRGTLAPSADLPGFPVRIPIIRDALLPTVGVGIPTSPVLGDVDGDGEIEIMVHPFAGKSYLVSKAGKIERDLSMKLPAGNKTNDTHMISGFGHPALGDVDGDGIPDPITVGSGKRLLTNLLLGGKKFDVNHMVSAWNGSTGQMIPGFPQILEDGPLSPAPAAVDLDGDGKTELLVGTGGYYFHAYNAQGEVAGFPHFTGGWTYGSPSVGDIDNDGKLEVAVSTREGYVFVWKTQAPRQALKSGWPTYKGNTRRTGVWGDN